VSQRQVSPVSIVIRFSGRPAGVQRIYVLSKSIGVIMQIG
jgi:hypothetical protein